MTDEEFLFRQTVRERKEIGRGDRYKKRGGGRYVRLPSDHLTRKERNALNGEVLTFNPNAWYSWEDFQRFPDDLQLRYVNSIINRYGASTMAISEIVFGKAKNTLAEHLKRKGLLQYVNKSAANGAAGTRARAALKNAIESGDAPTETDEKPAEAPCGAQDGVLTIDAGGNTPESENQISRLSGLLRLLAGTGAKLTIEVTL